MYNLKIFFGMISLLALCLAAFATPSTHIWAPSTDIQPYGKIHLTSDAYFPVKSRDRNDNKLYVQQVYGLTFSLLSDKPQDNLLGKIWTPLDKIMLEAGFDYKKGFGHTLDKWPLYFNFKFGISEDTYFKNMPAFAIGLYDIGYKRNYTNYNLLYFKGAKTLSIGKMNLGRFSIGYFRGNGRLLRDKDSERDNAGAMFAWERVMSEISDKLWLCLDYQGTQSSYGALNYGFSWKFTNNISAIIGYDVYNNPKAKNTVTLQLDIDF
jgi:hypothetical protein